MFAGIVLSEALEQAGVRIANGPPEIHPQRVELAEHVSPPLRNAAKVILKVSQNLHASMLPYLVGAYLDNDSTDRLQAGFDRERAMLERAGLDLTGAVQNDGAGGSALFSPDFMVRFLLHLHSQPFFPAFLDALPILGKDGTLVKIHADSPAAGHVFAKTGAFGGGNALTRGGLIHGKGLAGFIDTKDGGPLAFAAYINFVPVTNPGEDATQALGQALGEIAAAGYDGFR